MATTLEYYLYDTGIPEEDLDKPIDYKNTNHMGQYIPKDLGRIADGMPWQPGFEGAVARALELGAPDIALILSKDPKSRTYNCDNNNNYQ